MDEPIAKNFRSTPRLFAMALAALFKSIVNNRRSLADLYSTARDRLRPPTDATIVNCSTLNFVLRFVVQKRASISFEHFTHARSVMIYTFHRRTSEMGKSIAEE